MCSSLLGLKDLILSRLCEAETNEPRKVFCNIGSVRKTLQKIGHNVTNEALNGALGLSLTTVGHCLVQHKWSYNSMDRSCSSANWLFVGTVAIVGHVRWPVEDLALKQVRTQTSSLVERLVAVKSCPLIQFNFQILNFTAKLQLALNQLNSKGQTLLFNAILFAYNEKRHLNTKWQ